MELLRLNPISPKGDLIIVLALSEMESSTSQIRSHLISTSQAICLTGPCHSLKERNLAKINLLFCLI